MDDNKLLSLYHLRKKKKLLSNINKYEYSNTTKELLKSENNSHLKYHKLYGISNSNENSKKEKEKEKLRIKLKDKKKYEMLKKIFQKPAKKQAENIIKLEKAKQPFSSKNKIDSEIKSQKLKLQRPSRKYHDFYTIKWLKNKYSNSVLEKSINTLLPDNGNPVIPKDESNEEKKHRKLMEFMHSLKPVIEREKNVDINPKYFFNKNTFEKILKLKEIFLEFDEDGSRKMELDEMFTMFNQNNIFADLEDLVNLFYKNKKVKKKNIMNLYLDFFQFIQFSLERDQDFRYFMRKIKEKYKSRGYELDNNTYLPMSFNLILDYFIKKGKERSAIDNIRNVMKDMDDIFYQELKKDKKLKDLNLNVFSNKNRRKSVDVREKRLNNRLASIRMNNKKSTLSDEKSPRVEDDNKNYLEKLENINFKEPIKEFQKLFNIYGVKFSCKRAKSNIAYEKKMNKLYQSNNNSIISDVSTSYGKQTSGNGFPNNNKRVLYINEDSISGNISKNIENSEGNSVIKDIVNNYLNKKILNKLSKKNYEKFHNVQIAIDISAKSMNLKKKVINDKNIESFNYIKTDYNNYSKDNINKFNKTIFENKKNIFNSNNRNLKNTNLFVQNIPYFRNKNKAKNNMYPSDHQNKNLNVNEYFMKKKGNKTEINSSYNSFYKVNERKNKKNLFNANEKSISKIKYDYIPLDLLE